MLLSKEDKTKLEHAYRETWFRMREKGKMAYVLKYGILYFGFTIGAGAFIIEHWATPIDNLWFELLGAVIVWPIAGYIYGILSWRENEKRYLKKS